jgi:hypothetical protein
MMKKLLPMGAASTVIFLTAQSVFGNQTINSSSAALVHENTYLSAIKNKLSSMDRCNSESIDVFFSDPFVTYHSAELVNDAFQRVKKCDIKNIEVVLYESGDTLPPPELMKVEIGAFVDAHQPSEQPRYEVRKVEKSSPILNGLGAVIHFEVET